MEKSEIFNSVGKTFNKMIFTLKKHSPEILIVTGVIGAVSSAVLACKATTKVSTILDKTKEDVESVHKCLEANTPGDGYTEEDSKKDLALIYFQSGLKIAKLYAPAVILGGLSLAGIITSNRILRRRNVALAAAYAAVDTGFKKYRSRVIERFGEQVDQELRYNIKAKKVEETIVDENGEEKTVEKIINVADPDCGSPYAVFFDESNPNWEKSSDFNMMFLKNHQRWANDLLTARGYLFLNEVYEMMDFPKTKAGQIVGWKKDGDGNGYVDFGLFDVDKPAVRNFVEGYERSILLDFNVDGNIWEGMENDGMKIGK